MVRKVAKEEGKPICILADLQGPKIRTGKLVDHKPVCLVAGKRLVITPETMEGTAERVSTVFTTLAENLKPGDQILLSDGLIELRVVEIAGADVVTEIVNGGMLGENKGINLPGVAIKVPSLTEKDEIDLEFCLKAGADTVAVSFVQTAEDVLYVKRRIKELGSDAWVIAKLEKPQAVDHLDSILEAADGIMVARGDLGVEVPPEKVPAIQKHIIRRAAEYRKPVITATQMLESMIENPRPTRAEASDVANAIYDGSDAVMLSAESAAGKYPVESVAMMAKIILETEKQMQGLGQRLGPRHVSGGKKTFLTVPETICECMAHSAQDLDLAAIAIFTESGNTARLLSKYRPDAPIFALSPFEEVVHRAMLLVGHGGDPLRAVCRDRHAGVDGRGDAGGARVSEAGADCRDRGGNGDQDGRDELHAAASGGGSVVGRGERRDARCERREARFGDARCERREARCERREG